MKHRVPIHAYRLIYPDSSQAEMLWEWEQPYIDRLRWNAKTFGRTVAHCTFLHWNALAEANQRIWETYYRWPAYEPWESWQAWIAEYRMLVATAQDVYEAQYGKKRDAQ